MADVTDKDLKAYLDGKKELKDVVGFSPEYMSDLRGRAQFFLDGGHGERALIMLEMLEELDRKDPLPTLLAVELLLKDGKSDSAEAKLNLLKERFPGNPEVDVAEAELKIAIGELVPAAALLKKVIDKDAKGKTPAGKRALALAAQASQRFEQG